MSKVMRYSPVAGAPPTLPSSRPMPHAEIPLTMLLPASTPTMLSPRMVSMNSSADPNARMTGRAMSTNRVRISAPIRPPMSEAENAAPSARAASPRFASGKPSSTVACEALDPGMPISTEVNVSEVGMTATRPMSMASAEVASIP